MENPIINNHQDDRKFTIALIAFVMWVFITGIILVHSIMEVEISALSVWIMLSLFVFRTMNMIYTESHNNSKQWIENYTIKLLLKAPIEAIF